MGQKPWRGSTKKRPSARKFSKSSISAQPASKSSNRACSAPAGSMWLSHHAACNCSNATRCRPTGRPQVLGSTEEPAGRARRAQARALRLFGRAAAGWDRLLRPSPGRPDPYRYRVFRDLLDTEAAEAIRQPVLPTPPLWRARPAMLGGAKVFDPTEKCVCIGKRD